MAYEKEIETSTDDDMTNKSPSEIMTENNDIINNETVAPFEPSEFYNGACFHNYCWSQTVNEIGILKLNVE